MRFEAEIKLPANFSIDNFEGEKCIIQLYLSKSLDIYNSVELAAMIRILLQGGINKILLDIKNLESIDSSGIGVLIKAVKILRGKKGDLVLLNVPENIKKVFNMIKLERLIATFSSESDAFAYLRTK